MSILSENIRYLRGKLNLSQQRVADDLLITRGRYGKYEDGATEPPLDILVRISKYYNVSIDLLLTINVSKYSIDEIMELPDNRIVLPIRVDSNGNDEIEIIPQKASMGYLNGYGDPDILFQGGINQQINFFGTDTDVFISMKFFRVIIQRINDKYIRQIWVMQWKIVSFAMMLCQKPVDFSYT